MYRFSAFWLNVALFNLTPDLFAFSIVVDSAWHLGIINRQFLPKRMDLPCIAEYQ